MTLEPAPWSENPDAFTQEAVDTYIQTITGHLTATTEAKTSLETQLQKLLRLPRRLRDALMSSPAS